MWRATLADMPERPERLAEAARSRRGTSLHELEQKRAWQLEGALGRAGARGHGAAAPAGGALLASLV